MTIQQSMQMSIRQLCIVLTMVKITRTRLFTGYWQEQIVKIWRLLGTMNALLDNLLNFKMP